MADAKYVTRGALMWCDKGSHCRRINLINDHGMRIDVTNLEKEDKRYPFILDTDVAVGNEDCGKKDQQNISWFGVCNSDCLRTNERVGLKPDPRIAGEGNTATVTGKKCCPEFPEGTRWESVKEKIAVDTLETLQKRANGEMVESAHLLTTDSYLICPAGGGIIRFREVDNIVSDGTDYLKDQE